MPRHADERLYSNAVKWIEENTQDRSIPREIKEAFLRFKTLASENQIQLLISLNALPRLPQEIKESLPWLRFELEQMYSLARLPDELVPIIGAHLEGPDKSKIACTSTKMHSLFQPNRLLDTFLERVAFGEQEGAERLFTQVYQGNVEKIQVALCSQRRFTDYSGRTFHCSAYEYAYWAKDTHMCRMLEHHMNDATKTTMLERIEEIERIVLKTGQPMGLSYQQNGAEHRSAHFNFEPLRRAYEQYVNGYDAWRAASNWDALKVAWMNIGIAQRNVPTHVAQEYCHPTRSFDSLPSFNVDEERLPRVLTVYNWSTRRDALWFPLGLAESGVTLMRSNLLRCVGRLDGMGRQAAEYDLAAITHLDQVRHLDLKVSRDHLSPPGQPFLSM